MSKKTYSVPAVSCAHCKRTVEGALGAMTGVESASVDVERKTVDIVFDEALVSEEALQERLEQEGYPVA